MAILAYLYILKVATFSSILQIQKGNSKNNYITVSITSLFEKKNVPVLESNSSTGNEKWPKVKGLTTCDDAFLPDYWKVSSKPLITS